MFTVAVQNLRQLLCERSRLPSLIALAAYAGKPQQFLCFAQCGCKTNPVAFFLCHENTKSNFMWLISQWRRRRTFWGLAHTCVITSQEQLEILKQRNEKIIQKRDYIGITELWSFYRLEVAYCTVNPTPPERIASVPSLEKCDAVWKELHLSSKFLQCLFSQKKKKLGQWVRIFGRSPLSPTGSPLMLLRLSRSVTLCRCLQWSIPCNFIAGITLYRSLYRSTVRDGCLVSSAHCPKSFRRYSVMNWILGTMSSAAAVHLQTTASTQHFCYKRLNREAKTVPY